MMTTKAKQQCVWMPLCLCLAVACLAAAQRVGDVLPVRVADTAPAAVSDVRFDPPVTDGLVLHLDADAIEGLDDGDKIAQWNDLSGHGNHAAQAMEAHRPAYRTNVLDGKPVIRFDGSNRLEAAHSDSLNLDDAITIIGMVYDPPGWLTGWRYRKKITIDNEKVDSDLTHFPVTVILDGDTDFFDKSGPEDGKKVAFTKSDGITQLNAEVEQFDAANRKAVYHVSKSDWTISSTTATEFHVYYDSARPDNTNYIGETGSAVAHHVWDANFVGVWHKNDASDTAVRDSTINANDGSKRLANQPREAEGKIGKAQNYEGNGWARIDADPSHDVVSSLTISFWVKWNSSTKQHDIIVKDYATRVFSLYMFGASTLRFWVMSGNNWVGEGRDVAFSPETGRWYHIVGTRDSVYQRLYIDNIMQYGVAHGHGNVNVNSAITFGGNRYDYLDGFIDEVRISNTSRSAAWIKADYHSGKNTLMEYGAEEEAPGAVILGKGREAYQFEIDGNLMAGGYINGARRVSAPVTKNWHLATFSYDGSIVKLFVDGAEKDDAAYDQAIDTNTAGLAIGDLLNGDVAELLLYNRALSDAERQDVEQYLGGKWLGW